MPPSSAPTRTARSSGSIRRTLHGTARAETSSHPRTRPIWRAIGLVLDAVLLHGERRHLKHSHGAPAPLVLLDEPGPAPPTAPRWTGGGEYGAAGYDNDGAAPAPPG